MIDMEGVSFGYADGADEEVREPVLTDINLRVNQGEFVTLFGPNGSGKTTLLRIAAGLERPDEGRVTLGAGEGEPDRGFLFQDYDESLFPWFRVKQNILLHMRFRRVEKDAGNAEARLYRMLDAIGMELPLQRFPYELSGGQRQMIPVLRALLFRPDILFMDEPFSQLDYRVRSRIEEVLLHEWREYRPSVVFVSHDIEEAVFLADYVVLLSARPGTVVDVRKVPFERPRQRTLYAEAAFLEFSRDCLRVLYEDAVE